MLPVFQIIQISNDAMFVSHSALAAGLITNISRQ
jgi:hypothetical protein